MKKYILVVFDRYEVAKSEVINFNSYEHNLGLAFREAIGQLWQTELGDEFDLKRVKFHDNKVGIDFEEESYLFFEN
jgi:hypothetical protein